MHYKNKFRLPCSRLDFVEYKCWLIKLILFWLIWAVLYTLFHLRRDLITCPKSLLDIRKLFRISEKYFFSDTKTCRAMCLYVRNTKCFEFLKPMSHFRYPESFSDLLLRFASSACNDVYAAHKSNAFVFFWACDVQF